jgi:Integrase core domain
VFLDLDHARTKIATWADDYNPRRPHSALGYLTPAAYAANLSATCDRLRDPRPASPIACCSTRAASRKTRPGSNHRWMKVQWQVTEAVGKHPQALQFQFKRAINAGASC